MSQRHESHLLRLFLFWGFFSLMPRLRLLRPNLGVMGGYDWSIDVTGAKGDGFARYSGMSD